MIPNRIAHIKQQLSISSLKAQEYKQNNPEMKIFRTYCKENKMQNKLLDHQIKVIKLR
ncbi:unnamed protein product [Paramecium sonneborni]|uniref:Uncharacterized protein n=1 Tax=Paramecium sonneborni TaxID=65129 RepID=A0A8S1PVX0_9CILI|nr:unnamed protein product [Paramecium sonneborni]